jgi:hypothetical protein
MQTRIDMDGIRCRAGGPAKPKNDYHDKTKQAVTPDGRPIWVVRLQAFDMNANGGQGSSETIFVEVAGDKPELTTDELVQVDGLVYAPWISGPQRRDHKIVRAFRANAVAMAAAGGKAAHAA